MLQRMLEYAATHRGEGGNAESFFTAIVRSFCQDRGLVMAAQDHRGTFSVQKMVSIQRPCGIRSYSGGSYPFASLLQISPYISLVTLK